MQPLGENTVNVPAFLGKLWKMVNDPNTDHLISWSLVSKSRVVLELSSTYIILIGYHMWWSIVFRSNGVNNYYLIINCYSILFSGWK